VVVLVPQIEQPKQIEQNPTRDEANLNELSERNGASKLFIDDFDLHFSCVGLFRFLSMAV